MQTKKIFKVKIDDVNAELKLETSIYCIVGDNVLFDIPFSSVRAFEFPKPNKITMNFYKDEKLHFIKFSSKFAIKISDFLRTL